MSSLNVNFETQVDLSNKFTKVGYLFGGCTRKYSSIHLYEAQTLKPFTFDVPGFTFVQWRSDEDDIGFYSDEASIGGVNEPVLSTIDGTVVTLTAMYSENEYTIKFNYNGGEGIMNDLTVDYTEVINLLLNTFTRDGYTFSHWVDADGNVYTDGQEVEKLVTEGDIELVAV